MYGTGSGTPPLWESHTMNRTPPWQNSLPPPMPFTKTVSCHLKDNVLFFIQYISNQSTLPAVQKAVTTHFSSLEINTAFHLCCPFLNSYVYRRWRNAKTRPPLEQVKFIYLWLTRGTYLPDICAREPYKLPPSVSNPSMTHISDVATKVPDYYKSVDTGKNYVNGETNVQLVKEKVLTLMALQRIEEALAILIVEQQQINRTLTGFTCVRSSVKLEDQSAFTQLKNNMSDYANSFKHLEGLITSMSLLFYPDTQTIDASALALSTHNELTTKNTQFDGFWDVKSKEAVWDKTLLGESAPFPDQQPLTIQIRKPTLSRQSPTRQLLSSSLSPLRPSVKAESPEPVIEDQASPVSEIPQDHSNGLPDDKIECPLCQRCFPLDKIETHASDCLGPTEDNTVQYPETNAVRTKRRINNLKNEDILVINESSDGGGGKFGRILSSDSRRGRARTPPNHARCSFCSQVCKEGDEYFIHVQDCESKFQTIPSTSSMHSRTPGKVQTSYSASDVSSSSVRSRPPIGKGPSVLEQLEGGIAIQVHHGDITDAVYQNPTTAIVHIVNCIAVRPHGLSEILARKYPYCNTYKDRRPIGNLNRSCRADRGTPGGIQICRPRVYARDPIVVDIFGQFYMGKAYHKNFTSKKLVSQMKKYKENGELYLADGGSEKGKHASDNKIDEKYFDLHLLEGLLADTSENRIKWFWEALEKLAQSVAGEDIRTVVFPFGIGCGLAGGNWERDYYPAIERFSNTLVNQGVKIILVKKVEKTLSDQALTAAGSQQTSRYRGTKK